MPISGGGDILSVENVTAFYDGIEAVRGLSVRVGRSGITAIIGPNGAGKTTLLRVLSGRLRPKSGAVRFQAQPILGLAPHKIARLGLIQVPEGREILGPLSVEENLLLGRLAIGRRASPTKSTLDLAYDLFPVLKERRRQQSATLSGGQQQMLAIARALMGRPSLLLLDEPSLGLAPLVVDQVFEALAKLNATGLPIMLVEQNARRALEIAGYSYVLDRGRVVHEGPSSQLVSDQRIVEHYLGQSRHLYRRSVQPVGGSVTSLRGE